MKIFKLQTQMLADVRVTRDRSFAFENEMEDDDFNGVAEDQQTYRA
jgi:hypothetical protein